MNNYSQDPINDLLGIGEQARVVSSEEQKAVYVLSRKLAEDEYTLKMKAIKKQQEINDYYLKVVKEQFGDISDALSELLFIDRSLYLSAKYMVLDCYAKDVDDQIGWNNQILAELNLLIHEWRVEHV